MSKKNKLGKKSKINNKKFLKLSIALFAGTSLSYGVIYGISSVKNISNIANKQEMNSSSRTVENGMLADTISSYNNEKSVSIGFQAIINNGMTISDNSNKHMLLATTSGYSLIDTQTLEVLYNYEPKSDAIYGARQITYDKQTGLFYILSYYNEEYHFLYVNPEYKIGGEFEGEFSSRLDGYVMTKNGTSSSNEISYLLYYRGEIAANENINNFAPMKMVKFNKDNTIQTFKIPVGTELNRDQRRYIIGASLMYDWFSSPSSTLFVEYYMPDRENGALSSVWAWTKGHFYDPGNDAVMQNEYWVKDVNPNGFNISHENITQWLTKCNPVNQAVNYTVTNNTGDCKKSIWLALEDKLICLTIKIGGENGKGVERNYKWMNATNPINTMTSSYYNGKLNTGGVGTFSKNITILFENGSLATLLGKEGPYTQSEFDRINEVIGSATVENSNGDGIAKRTNAAVDALPGQSTKYNNFYTTHDGNSSLSFASDSQEAWAVAIPNNGTGSWAYSIFPYSIKIIKPEFDASDFVSDEKITMDSEPFNDNSTLKQKIVGEWKSKIFIDAKKYPTLTTSEISTFKVSRDTEANKINIKMQFNIFDSKSDEMDFSIIFEKPGLPKWIMWAGIGGGAGLVLLIIIIAIAVHAKTKRKQDDLSNKMIKLMARQTSNPQRMLPGPSESENRRSSRSHRLPRPQPDAMNNSMKNSMHGHMGNQMNNGPMGPNQFGPMQEPMHPQGPKQGPIMPPPPPMPGPRPGNGAQRPGMERPSAPLPPKVEINAPPKSLAPKKK